MAGLGARRSQRNHFVPVFYLRRFAKDDRLIAVNVKTRETLENQRVDRVAFARNTSQPDGIVVPAHFDIEREIAELEGDFAAALRQISSSFPPDPSMRALVADFVVFQLVRQPAKQRINGEDRRGDWLFTLGLLMKDPDDPKRREMLATSELLEGRLAMREAISDRRWVLFEVPTAGTKEFITSDAPVYLANESGVSESSHAAADTVYLPLDRRHVLAMRRGELSEERTIEASARHVSYLNQAVARNATRFVYAHPDCHRGLLASAVRGDDYQRLAARQQRRS